MIDKTANAESRVEDRVSFTIILAAVYPGNPFMGVGLADSVFLQDGRYYRAKSLVLDYR